MEQNGRIAVVMVEETEVKKPEKQIVTVECTDAWGEVETRVLKLTPDQYRFLEWLSVHEMFCDSFEWHGGKPEVEIEEI